MGAGLEAHDAPGSRLPEQATHTSADPEHDAEKEEQRPWCCSWAGIEKLARGVERAERARMAERAQDDEHSRLLLALEDFFCSPAFTCALGGFMDQHASELQFPGPDAEQPLHNHAVFTRFQAVVEEQLCSFLQEHGISQEAVVQVCQEAKSRDGGHGSTSHWVCIDYLLASTTYESFMELAADHVQLHSWGAEPGALDDYELPPPDEEEGEDGQHMLPLDEADPEEQAGEQRRSSRRAAVAAS